MSVAENISSYIVDKGINQTLLAKNIGIPQQSLNKVVNKKRSLTADEFAAICKFLEIPPEHFMDKRPR